MKIPLSGSRVVPCGLTDRRTDMKKIIVALCNFAKSPKSGTEHIQINKKKMQGVAAFIYHFHTRSSLTCIERLLQ